jgi:hypothetical protein
MGQKAEGAKTVVGRGHDQVVFLSEPFADRGGVEGVGRLEGPSVEPDENR